MTSLRDELAGLSPEQLELLQRRLAAKRQKDSKRSSGLVPQSRDPERFPLTVAQQRFWFLDRLNPGTPDFNVPVAVRLRGPLRVEILEQSFSEVVNRHEILRVRFSEVDGEGRQAIGPRVQLTVPVEDLSQIAVQERRTEMSRRVQREARHSFDLSTDLLVRVVLLKLSEVEHVVCLNLHHIISDRWSVALFLNEVLGTYQARVEGYQQALPELSLQFIDFAIWQQEQHQRESTVLERQFAFWKEALRDAPKRLNLPSDRPRSTRRDVSGRVLKECKIRLPQGVRESVRGLARQHEASTSMVLIAIFDTLLSRLSGQLDVVIGSPVANRDKAVLQDMLGYFANDVLLRVDLSGNPTFGEVLGRVRQNSLESYENAQLPFERILQAFDVERDPTLGSPVQVFFVLENVPSADGDIKGIEVEILEVEQGAGQFELLVYLTESETAIEGSFFFDPALFDDDTTGWIVETYVAWLEQVCVAPQVRLDELELVGDLPHRVAAAHQRDREQLIAVAATFTGEPIEDSLEFWTDFLDLPSRIEFAPYNQVFQQLLDPTGLMRSNAYGVNVVLFRFEDWQRYRSESGSDSDLKGFLWRALDDLVAGFEQVSAASSVPYLVVSCPASPEFVSRPGHAKLLTGLEEQLASRLRELSGVVFMAESEFRALYPVAAPHDPHADEVGHVPYTPELFAALGTAVARRLVVLRNVPRKVIAVDCDQTLWRGVCAEDGPSGISIDAPYRRLQEFLVGQHDAGMLICLASKNSPEDVAAVFAERGDMPLKDKHVVSRQINWDPKSTQLKRLAEELDLGLDSFIMIDDNPVECAEITSHCPQVLTLRLPSDPNDIPGFLENVWAFDRLHVTDEDRRRTALYQQNVERQQFQREAPGFLEFIDGLELEIEIAVPLSEDMERLAQLTQRTNQFNLTTRRRDVSEVEAFLRRGEARIVKVSDRFGDYGLVGVLLFSVEASDLSIDTWLLSCRVLGRGIEHRMMVELGSLARERGLERLLIPYRRSERNQPARAFLSSVAESWRDATGDVERFAVPVEAALAVCLRVGAADDESASSEVVTPVSAPTVAPSEQIQRIATELGAAHLILAQVRARRRQHRPKEARYVEPATPFEEMVAEIWQEILEVDRIGSQDHFFQLGGHSLMGTILLSRLRDAFGIELPLSAIFEVPTVATLAERVELELIGEADLDDLESIEHLSEQDALEMIERETRTEARRLPVGSGAEGVP